MIYTLIGINKCKGTLYSGSFENIIININTNAIDTLSGPWYNGAPSELALGGTIRAYKKQ